MTYYLSTTAATCIGLLLNQVLASEHHMILAVDCNGEVKMDVGMYQKQQCSQISFRQNFNYMYYLH